MVANLELGVIITPSDPRRRTGADSRNCPGAGATLQPAIFFEPRRHPWRLSRAQPSPKAAGEANWTFGHAKTDRRRFPLIRVVLEGLRGEASIAELRRRERIASAGGYAGAAGMWIAGTSSTSALTTNAQ